MDNAPIVPIPIHTQQSLVPEQLLERDRQRQEELLLRRQHIELPTEEHPDYIAQKFSELAADIKECISVTVKNFQRKPFDSSLSALPSSSHDECDSSSPQHKFAALAARIGELQRYLTACTRFLPDYKIKACTQIISELNKSLEDGRQQIIPKKKFGFSARNKAAKKAKQNDENDEKEKCDALKPLAIDNKSVTDAADTLSLKYSKHVSSRHNEYILETCEQINKHDVTLVNLKNCFVELRGHPSSVRADNLSDCIVLMGPVSSSVYVENCANTTFAIACQQLRCHNSSNCRVFLHVTCRAVIEDCKNMEFSNYNYKYAEIDQDFIDAGLDRCINNYADVADFNWLSPHAPSPNWRLLQQQQHNDKPFDFESLRRDFLNNATVVTKS